MNSNLKTKDIHINILKGTNIKHPQLLEKWRQKGFNVAFLPQKDFDKNKEQLDCNDSAPFIVYYVEGGEYWGGSWYGCEPLDNFLSDISFKKS